MVGSHSVMQILLRVPTVSVITEFGCIQLFQLTLSDQSLKLKGIFKAAASSST